MNRKESKLKKVTKVQVIPKETHKKGIFSNHTPLTIKMEDLLNPLEQTSSAQNLDIFPQQIQKSTTIAPAINTSSLKKGLHSLIKDKKSQSLALPLSGSAHNQIQRKQTYQTSSKEAEKWIPHIKHYKHSNHIDFTQGTRPVNATLNTIANSSIRKIKEASVQDLTTDQKQASFQAMQVKIQKHLKQSGNDTQTARLQKQQQIMTRQLTPQQISTRVKQLARMKHLLFRQQAKRKRISKIKSKLYHKFKKKQKQKQQSQVLQQLGDIDPQAANNIRLRMEQQRAEERVKMRHSSSSKFAKTLMRFGKKKDDKQLMEAYHEMLRKREQLKNKVKSINGVNRTVLKDQDDDQVLSFFSQDLETEEQNQKELRDKLIQKFQKQIKRENEEGYDDDDALNIGFQPKIVKKKQIQKGLNSMRFMKKALQAQQVHAQAEGQFLIQQMKKQFDQDGQQEDNDKIQQKAYENKFKGKRFVNQSKEGQKKKQIDDILLKQLATGEIINQTNQKVTKKKIWKQETDSDDSSDQDALRIDKNDLQRIRKQKRKYKIQDQDIKGLRKEFNQQQINNSSQDDDNQQNQIQQSADELEQNLLDRIFTTGNENQKQFIQAKNQQIKNSVQDPNKVKLVGWNHWAGEGIQQKQTDAQILMQRKKRKIQQAKKKRKDGQFDTVKISEKRDKKFKKYQIQKLPHPFTGAKQFQALMSVPMGKDWNTLQSYKRLIQPKVITKAGQIIRSLKYRKDIPIQSIDSLLQQRKNPSRKAAKF